MRIVRALLLALVFVLASACAGGPRARVMSAVEANDVDQAIAEYERYRTDEGIDTHLLARVAGLVLERAAVEGDARSREAALSQLTMAGTAGVSVVEALTHSEHAAPLRARALLVLARRGDGSARAELRGLADDRDAEVLAAAAAVLDGGDDEGQLRELAVHTSADVRAAAVTGLAGAAPSTEALLLLAEAARVDPEPRVRAAAVRSLAGYREAAFEHIRERLGDPHSSVRTAAVLSLVRVDRARALASLGPLLEIAPSAAGVEAARVLAMPVPDADEDAEPSEGAVLARAFLRRALTAADGAVRAQAAVALSSLPPDDGLDRDLVAALRDDAEPSVKLSLAVTLRRRDQTERAAVAALRALMEEEGMPSLQAAAILAADGDAGAKRKLSRALRDESAAIRRVAARALARDALDPDAARGALSDDDPLVRIHAAGGILAAANVL